MSAVDVTPLVRSVLAMRHGDDGPYWVTIASPRPHREDAVTLTDGRRLGWAEYGATDGRPVLWFHGTPGARRQLPPDAGPAAAERGLRLLTVERPGAGWSTPHLYGSIRDWADDIRQFADHLGLDRFACVGLSGGGPYTLACAHDLGDSVAVAGVLGGIGPTVGREAAPGYTRALGFTGPFFRAVSGPASWSFATAMRAIKPIGPLAGQLYARLGPKSDRPVLQDPRIMEILLDDLLGALDLGLRAPIYDLVLFAQHWGFEMADITVPVRFWQGEADLIVPLSHSTHQADLVPDSKVVHKPQAGHFAGYTEVGSVFDTLIDDWSEPAEEEQAGGRHHAPGLNALARPSVLDSHRRSRRHPCVVRGGRHLRHLLQRSVVHHPGMPGRGAYKRDDGPWINGRCRRLPRPALR